MAAPDPGAPAATRHRRVDRWLRRAAWTVVLLSCLQVVLFGFGRDQGIYAVVASTLLDGGMPYRDAWDFKPPGIFAVFALAEVLFGRAMSSVRLLECLGILSLVLAAGRIGREAFGSRTAGLAGGALAALMHAELEFWHTAQPESFGGILTVWALALSVGSGPRGARGALGRALAVGALFGAAFLLKPPLGGGAAPVALFLALAEWRRSGSLARGAGVIAVAALGSLLPIAATLGWFQVRGALPELRWTLFEFTPGYTRLGWSGEPLGLFRYGLVEALTGFSFLLPALLLAALALPPRSPRERPFLLLVAGIVVVHVAGIALQAKFFQYHYGATLPLLSLAGGLGLAKLARLAAGRGPVALVGLAAVVMALAASRVALRHNPGTFWERSAARLAYLLLRQGTREELDARLYHVADYSLDVDRRAAREIARLTAPGDRVYVWGFEPVLYWFSGRRPASRFVYDVPQRARWERKRARADLLGELLASPPRVIAVQHGDVFSFVTGDSLDSAGALEGFPELAALLAGEYELASAVEDIDLYLRVAPDPAR